MFSGGTLLCKKQPTMCWTKQQRDFSWTKAGESPREGVFSSIQQMNGVVWLSPDSVTSLKYSRVQVWCAHYCS